MAMQSTDTYNDTGMQSTDTFYEMAIEPLENGFATIAGLTYNRRGKVVDFGNSNGEELCEWRDENGVKQSGYQECWKLLHVTVFVDSFAGLSRNTLDHEWQGWVWYKKFWAGSWPAIPEVFEICGATAGLYHNVQFRVDIMKWTSVTGWQYEDHL